MPKNEKQAAPEEKETLLQQEVRKAALSPVNLQPSFTSAINADSVKIDATSPSVGISKEASSGETRIRSVHVQKISAGKATPVQSPQSDHQKYLTRKRSDGITEIALKNGTLFSGVKKAETDQVITIQTDGAMLNIFKKLIREIDGSFYTGGGMETDLFQNRERVVKAPAHYPKPQHQMRTSQTRLVPQVIVPEGVSVGDLGDSLRSGEWQQRSRAARYLGAMGQWGTSAIPLLAKQLEDTTQRLVFAPVWIDSSNVEKLLSPGLEAARALSCIGGDGPGVLREALKGSDPLVRKHAAFGLCELSDESTGKLLLAIFSDPESQVRVAGLGFFRAGTYFDQLVTALKDNDSEVRERAVFLIGRTSDEHAVPILTEFLKDKHSRVRARAAEALGSIGGVKSVRALIGALDDGNVFVREHAAGALGELKDTVAVWPLIMALKDGNAAVRSAAAFALGKIRDPRAIPSLYSLLKDEQLRVRQIAQQSLSMLTDISQLITALDDKSPMVRENVAYVLWLMTGKDLGQDKGLWLEWYGDPAVQSKEK